MNPRSFTWALSALAAVVLSSGVIAQETARDSSTARLPVAVNLPFFAEEKHSNLTNAITTADLSILDNQKPPQSVVAIRTAKDLPLRLGILVDTSNSERTSSLYRPGLNAIIDLVHQVLAGPDDEVFVVTFDAIPTATGFMGKEEFAKFKANATPGGGTAFFDAVYFACKERMEADPTQPARRLLVILSDGGDNMSHVDHDKAIAAAQEASAVIFAVSTNEAPGENLDDVRLRQFGERTGGQSFLHLSAGGIPKAFRRIREQVANMYVVTYVPQEYGAPGQRHTIELRPLLDKKLKLRAPKAYYPPPTP